MNIYLPNLRLPSAYQEVEYIGTSGTQYIDSGVTIGSSTNNEIIEGKIQFNSNSSAQVNGKNQKKVLFFGTNASNVFYAGIGDNYGNTNLTNDGNAHIFKILQSEYKLYVDGTGYTLTSTAFKGDIYSSNIYIGAASDAVVGTARFYVNERIYYFKIWQGGNLVRNFIPCYRKSDNVIGLYDLVNNQFYTNSGTGTFSKGNDVTMAELKNAYIGEVYDYSYTFKGKTAAEIGSEWTSLVGTIYTNSNGFTGVQDSETRIKKNIPSLTNAKKIIISGTIVGQNSSKTAALIGVGKGTGWGTGHTSYQVYGSSFNGMKANLYYNNTDISGNSVGNATAQTYKPTLTINLENKTIVGSVSGFSNSTLSLTDAQVADIREYEYILCYVSWDRSTISDVSITIEY